MQNQESSSADYAAILQQLEQESGMVQPQQPTGKPLMSDRAIAVWTERLWGAIGGLLLCWVLFVLPNAIALSQKPVQSVAQAVEAAK